MPPRALCPLSEKIRRKKPGKKSTMKKPGKKPSMEVAKDRTYKLIKGSIVRVSRCYGLVKCDFPVTNLVRFDKKSGFHVTVNGNNITFHRVVFDVKVSRTVAKGKEICHTCANKYCCRPSHLEKGQKGVHLGRRGCYGFVRFGSNNELAKVCEHGTNGKKPCPVVTDFESISAEHSEVPKGGSKVKGCYGFVKCGDLLARVCNHNPPCSVITDIAKIRAAPGDVDPIEEVDKDVKKTMSVKEFREASPLKLSDPEDSEEEEESDPEEEEEESETEEEDSEEEVNIPRTRSQKRP